MINRLFIVCLFLTGIMTAIPARAFDISGCLDDYAKEHNIEYDLERPDSMLLPIVYCHTVTGKSAQDAMDAGETINNIINTYALELYGNAVSTRAQMVADAQEGSSASILKQAISLTPAENKKEIIQDKVAPNYKNIAKAISKIIELEGQIANLEAAKMISAEKDGAALFEKEDE